VYTEQIIALQVMCYGVETWFDCAPTHKKKLQIIPGVIPPLAALHEDTNMPRIEDFGDRIRDKFSQFSENALILAYVSLRAIL
jgi:hypothetical protein